MANLDDTVNHLIEAEPQVRASRGDLTTLAFPSGGRFLCLTLRPSELVSLAALVNQRCEDLLVNQQANKDRPTDAPRGEDRRDPSRPFGRRKLDQLMGEALREYQARRA